MPLDPAARAFLDWLKEIGRPPVTEVTPVEAREGSRLMAQRTGGVREPLAQVSEERVPVSGGDIAVRVYVPGAEPPLPVVVYYHGGGWVLGSLDTSDTVCSMIANRVPAVVVSVDYRLAPEHKFPTAVLDSYAAARWVAENAGRIGGDPARMAVAGDSAGGNLAAVTAVLARDEGTPLIGAQVLIYPVTDHAADTESYELYAQDYFLTGETMRWFWQHYLREETDGRDWRASPLRLADPSGLPPALILTAEYDPLRDEGEAYGQLLQRAGVEVTIHRYLDQMHAFFTMPAVMPRAREAVQEVSDFLRRVLN